MDNSDYAYAAFLVSTCCSFGIAGFAYLLAGAIFMYAKCRQRATKEKVWVMCGIILFGNAWFTVGLGVLSGFDLIPPAATLAIACFCIAVVTFLGMPIFSSAWKIAFIESSSTTETMRSYASASYRAILNQPAIFHAGCVIGYLFCYAVIFTLYGVCFCDKPFAITTWASRRDQPKYCFNNEVCHQYVMLGYNSSRIRIVSHIVSDGAPLMTWGVVCPISSLDVCSAAMFSVNGLVVPHHPTTDDPRYLSHILLKNLSGSTDYTATIYFTLASGINISKAISFTTVPDPSDPREVQFVSGGDLLSTNEGQNFELVGFLKSDPHFVLFGGDLSYSNNMRTCYLRMDYFCALVTSLQNRKGRSVPLLVMTGNHESGGYLLNSANWNKFFYMIEYFPQDDDDVPSTTFRTHHTHVVGANLAVIGIDSNLMESAAAQVPYVAKKLVMCNLEDRFAIAAYHNPLFPSVRNYDDSASDIMRSTFSPIMAQHRLPLSLEFHDHAYKRTFPMIGEDISLNGSGTVFIGDGGMGIQRSQDDIASRPYLRVARSVANVEVVTIFPNKSALVTAYAADLSVIDSVYVNRW